MPSKKTLRRRRGRAIRNARRDPTNPRLEWLRRVWANVTDALRLLWSNLQLILYRLTPALLPPDARGARRQLLHKGRAPRRQAGRRW